MKIHSNPNFPCVPCDASCEPQRTEKRPKSCSQSFVAELQARNAKELERLRGKDQNQITAFDRTHTHKIHIQTGPPIFLDPEDQSRHVHFIELQHMP